MDKFRFIFVLTSLSVPFLVRFSFFTTGFCVLSGEAKVIKLLDADVILLFNGIIIRVFGSVVALYVTFVNLSVPLMEPNPEAKASPYIGISLLRRRAKTSVFVPLMSILYLIFLIKYLWATYPFTFTGLPYLSRTFMLVNNIESFLRISVSENEKSAPSKSTLRRPSLTAAFVSTVICSFFRLPHTLTCPVP